MSLNLDYDPKVGTRFLPGGMPEPQHCGLVDVLLGLQDDGIFRLAADESDAQLLFAELRSVLSLQSAMLRMRLVKGTFEFRLSHRVGDDLS